MIFRDEKRRNGWWVEIHVLVGRVVEHEKKKIWSLCGNKEFAVAVYVDGMIRDSSELT